MVLPFEFVDEILRCDCAVLFIVLYKVVLPFESAGEILKCDYSNEK